MFVGGAVRDLMLGREIHEVDIATDALPEQVAGVFPHTVFVGAAFGVVQVIRKGRAFEVATFRKERGYSDGRHPDIVSPGSVEEDVERRDFTVNGLVLDPATGTVSDHVGGIEDLRTKTLRAIGAAEERLQEDYLRCLRAVRFAAVLGFNLEPATRLAVCKAAAGIARISRERVAAELQKLASAGVAHTGLQILFGVGLEPYVFPFLPLSAPEVQASALRMLSQLPQPVDVPSLLAALNVAASGREISTVSERELCRILSVQEDSLRLSRDDRGKLHDLCRLAANAPAIAGMRLARRLDLYRSGHFPAVAVLARELLAQAGLPLTDLESLETEFSGLGRDSLQVKRLVTGKDLIRRGIPPGPAYKRLLAEARDLAAEGVLRSRQEALDWLKSAGLGGEDPEVR